MSNSKRARKNHSTRYQTSENEHPARQGESKSRRKRKAHGSGHSRCGNAVLSSSKLSKVVKELINTIFSSDNDLTKDLIEVPAVRLLEEISEPEAINAINEFADRYKVAKHKILRSTAGYFRGVCQKYWKANRDQKKQELLRKASSNTTPGKYSRQMSPLVSETIESLFTPASGLAVSIIDESVQRRLGQLTDEQAIEALHEFCSAVMYRQDRIRNMNAYLMNIIKRRVTGNHQRSNGVVDARRSSPRGGGGGGGSGVVLEGGRSSDSRQAVPTPRPAPRTALRPTAPPPTPPNVVNIGRQPVRVGFEVPMPPPPTGFPRVKPMRRRRQPPVQRSPSLKSESTDSPSTSPCDDVKPHNIRRSLSAEHPRHFVSQPAQASRPPKPLLSAIRKSNPVLAERDFAPRDARVFDEETPTFRNVQSAPFERMRQPPDGRVKKGFYSENPRFRAEPPRPRDSQVETVAEGRENDVDDELVMLDGYDSEPDDSISGDSDSGNDSSEQQEVYSGPRSYGHGQRNSNGPPQRGSDNPQMYARNSHRVDVQENSHQERYNSLHRQFRDLQNKCQRLEAENAELRVHLSRQQSFDAHSQVSSEAPYLAPFQTPPTSASNMAMMGAHRLVLPSPTVTGISLPNGGPPPMGVGLVNHARVDQFFPTNAGLQNQLGSPVAGFVPFPFAGLPNSGPNTQFFTNLSQPNSVGPGFGYPAAYVLPRQSA